MCLACYIAVKWYVSAQVLKMFKPTLDKDESLQPFLAAQIQSDIRHVSQCCVVSTEECMLLIHDVVSGMRQGDII